MAEPTPKPVPLDPFAQAFIDDLGDLTAEPDPLSSAAILEPIPEQGGAGAKHFTAATLKDAQFKNTERAITDASRTAPPEEAYTDTLDRGREMADRIVGTEPAPDPSMGLLEGVKRAYWGDAYPKLMELPQSERAGLIGESLTPSVLRAIPELARTHDVGGALETAGEDVKDWARLLATPMALGPADNLAPGVLPEGSFGREDFGTRNVRIGDDVVPMESFAMRHLRFGGGIIMAALSATAGEVASRWTPRDVADFMLVQGALTSQSIPSGVAAAQAIAMSGVLSPSEMLSVNNAPEAAEAALDAIMSGTAYLGVPVGYRDAPGNLARAWAENADEPLISASAERRERQEYRWDLRKSYLPDVIGNPTAMYLQEVSRGRGFREVGAEIALTAGFEPGSPEYKLAAGVGLGVDFLPLDEGVVMGMSKLYRPVKAGAAGLALDRAGGTGGVLTAYNAAISEFIGKGGAVDATRVPLEYFRKEMAAGRGLEAWKKYKAAQPELAFGAERMYSAGEGKRTGKTIEEMLGAPPPEVVPPVTPAAPPAPPPDGPRPMGLQRELDDAEHYPDRADAKTAAPPPPDDPPTAPLHDVTGDLQEAYAGFDDSGDRSPVVGAPNEGMNVDVEWTTDDPHDSAIWNGSVEADRRFNVAVEYDPTTAGSTQAGVTEVGTEIHGEPTEWETELYPGTKRYMPERIVPAESPDPAKAARWSNVTQEMREMKRGALLDMAEGNAKVEEYLAVEARDAEQRIRMASRYPTDPDFGPSEADSGGLMQHAADQIRRQEALAQQPPAPHPDTNAGFVPDVATSWAELVNSSYDEVMPEDVAAILYHQELTDSWAQTDPGARAAPPVNDEVTVVSADTGPEVTQRVSTFMPGGRPRADGSPTNRTFRQGARLPWARYFETERAMEVPQPTRWTADMIAHQEAVLNSPGLPHALADSAAVTHPTDLEDVRKWGADTRAAAAEMPREDLKAAIGAAVDVGSPDTTIAQKIGAQSVLSSFRGEGIPNVPALELVDAVREGRITEAEAARAVTLSGTTSGQQAAATLPELQAQMAEWVVAGNTMAQHAAAGRWSAKIDEAQVALTKRARGEPAVQAAVLKSAKDKMAALDRAAAITRGGGNIAPEGMAAMVLTPDEMVMWLRSEETNAQRQAGNKKGVDIRKRTLMRADANFHPDPKVRLQAKEALRQIELPRNPWRGTADTYHQPGGDVVHGGIRKGTDIVPNPGAPLGSRIAHALGFHVSAQPGSGGKLPPNPAAAVRELAGPGLQAAVWDEARARKSSYGVRSGAYDGPSRLHETLPDMDGPKYRVTGSKQHLKLTGHHVEGMDPNAADLDGMYELTKQGRRYEGSTLYVEGSNRPIAEWRRPAPRFDARTGEAIPDGGALELVAHYGASPEEARVVNEFINSQDKLVQRRVEWGPMDRLRQQEEVGKRPGLGRRGAVGAPSVDELRQRVAYLRNEFEQWLFKSSGFGKLRDIMISLLDACSFADDSIKAAWLRMWEALPLEQQVAAVDDGFMLADGSIPRERAPNAVRSWPLEADGSKPSVVRGGDRPPDYRIDSPYHVYGSPLEGANMPPPVNPNAMPYTEREAGRHWSEREDLLQDRRGRSIFMDQPDNDELALPPESHPTLEMPEAPAEPPATRWNTLTSALWETGPRPATDPPLPSPRFRNIESPNLPPRPDLGRTVKPEGAYLGRTDRKATPGWARPGLDPLRGRRGGFMLPLPSDLGRFFKRADHVDLPPHLQGVSDAMEQGMKSFMRARMGETHMVPFIGDTLVTPIERTRILAKMRRDLLPLYDLDKYYKSGGLKVDEFGNLELNGKQRVEFWDLHAKYGGIPNDNRLAAVSPKMTRDLHHAMARELAGRGAWMNLAIKDLSPFTWLATRALTVAAHGPGSEYLATGGTATSTLLAGAAKAFVDVDGKLLRYRSPDGAAALATGQHELSDVARGIAHRADEVRHRGAPEEGPVKEGAERKMRPMGEVEAFLHVLGDLPPETFRPLSPAVNDLVDLTLRPGITVEEIGKLADRILDSEMTVLDKDIERAWQERVSDITNALDGTPKGAVRAEEQVLKAKAELAKKWAQRRAEDRRKIARTWLNAVAPGLDTNQQAGVLRYLNPLSEDAALDKLYHDAFIRPDPKAWGHVQYRDTGGGVWQAGAELYRGGGKMTYLNDQHGLGAALRQYTSKKWVAPPEDKVIFDFAVTLQSEAVMRETVRKVLASDLAVRSGRMANLVTEILNNPAAMELSWAASRGYAPTDVVEAHRLIQRMGLEPGDASKLVELEHGLLTTPDVKQKLGEAQAMGKSESASEITGWMPLGVNVDTAMRYMKISALGKLGVFASPARLLADAMGTIPQAYLVRGGTAVADVVGTGLDPGAWAISGHMAEMRSRKWGPARPATAFGKATDVYVFPTGVYTQAELVAEFHRRGLDSQAARAENGAALIDDVRRHDYAVWRQLIAFDDHVQFVNEVSNMFDMSVRSRIALGELKRGATLDEACLAAREALYDYSGLSAWERKVGRAMFPWYTFTKRNAEANLKAMLTNPQRVAYLTRLMYKQPDLWGWDDDQKREMPANKWGGVIIGSEEGRDLNYTARQYMLTGVTPADFSLWAFNHFNASDPDTMAEAWAADMWTPLQWFIEEAARDTGFASAEWADRNNEVPGWWMMDPTMAGYLKSAYGVEAVYLGPNEPKDRATTHDENGVGQRWVVGHGFDRQGRSARAAAARAEFRTKMAVAGRVPERMRQYVGVFAPDARPPGQELEGALLQAATGAVPVNVPGPEAQHERDLKQEIDRINERANELLGPAKTQQPGIGQYGQE